MLSNKNFNPIVTELFIRDRKLNISLVFNLVFDHSLDIDFQDFMNLYKNVPQNHILF